MPASEPNQQRKSRDGLFAEMPKTPSIPNSPITASQTFQSLSFCFSRSWQFIREDDGGNVVLFNVLNDMFVALV